MRKTGYFSSLGLFVVTTFIGLFACSNSETPKNANDGTMEGTDGPDPSDVASIKQFLLDQKYIDWTCEDAPRQARTGSAHGRARVCVDPLLATSLQAGNTLHPKGSMAVKELYTESDELSGHAMVIKTATPDDIESWTWYEDFAPDYDNPFYGAGISECAICHSGGADHIFFELP